MPKEMGWGGGEGLIFFLADCRSALGVKKEMPYLLGTTKWYWRREIRDWRLETLSLGDHAVREGLR